jgi:hypothetical protein
MQSSTIQIQEGDRYRVAQDNWPARTTTAWERVLIDCSE